MTYTDIKDQLILIICFIQMFDLVDQFFTYKPSVKLRLEMGAGFRWPKKKCVLVQ